MEVGKGDIFIMTQIENTNATNEVVEPEVVDATKDEKKENIVVRTFKSAGSKVKGFATKHKKGLLIGAGAVAAVGLILKSRADSDDTDEYEDDEYEDDEYEDDDYELDSEVDDTNSDSNSEEQ